MSPSRGVTEKLPLADILSVSISESSALPIDLLLLHCLEEMVKGSPRLVEAVGTAASVDAGNAHTQSIISEIVSGTANLSAHNLRERYADLYLTGKLLQLTTEAAGTQICTKHGPEAELLRLRRAVPVTEQECEREEKRVAAAKGKEFADALTFICLLLGGWYVCT
jgi:hypothetical protein